MRQPCSKIVGMPFSCLFYMRKIWSTSSSTRVETREGKMLNSSRDKKIEAKRTVVGRREEGALCDPRSDVLLGGRARVVRG